MEFRIQINLQLSFSKPSKMAIAFFVDPEYGPVTTPVPPPPPVRRIIPRRAPIVTIDENNNHVIPDLSFGVAYYLEGSRSQGQGQVSREPKPLSWKGWLVNRILSPFQTASSSMTRGDNRILVDNEVQDGIECTHGFSLDLSFQSTRIGVSREVTPGRRCRHPAGNQVHQLNNVNHLMSSQVDLIEQEWNVELKLGVNLWKEVGTDLRQVADAFEFETSLQRRQSSNQDSVQVRCVLRLSTLPMLAVVAVATGLVYWRRHL